ncbi:hypothetical protein TYRP_005067 [Tyrophagus putrescentiae]|nr:hypothetical protein TYRP_005067 [Tyrophagus putrescentiae]
MEREVGIHAQRRKEERKEKKEEEKQLLLGGEHKGDDQPVETQHLCENENENHADEETRLLGRAADARVADYADGEACRQAGQTQRRGQRPGGGSP